MAKIVSVDEFAGMAGTELPPSEWLEIEQDRVNQFADATDDHQFIHVDAERAAATPFGGTIAHGYLTMSMISRFLLETSVMPEGAAMALNYGSDKIRYLTPVRVGNRIRACSKILELNEKRPGQWLVKTGVTIEIENESTPALIAEILSMYIIE